MKILMMDEVPPSIENILGVEDLSQH
jgi:hypothetical protein